MPTTFTFSDYDIGNSLIVPEDNNNRVRSFAISTKRGFMEMHQYTTIRFADHGMALGALDWKNKIVEIGGVRRPSAEVSRKIGGVLSLTREWKWSDKTYMITHKNRIWTAKCDENTIAVYTPLKRHPFDKDELATINFLTDVPDGEMVLVILALLHGDIQLPPPKRPKNFNQAAGDQAVKLGATVVGNVVANSCACTIQ